MSRKCILQTKPAVQLAASVWGLNTPWLSTWMLVCIHWTTEKRKMENCSAKCSTMTHLQYQQPDLIFKVVWYALVMTHKVSSSHLFWCDHQQVPCRVEVPGTELPHAATDIRATAKWRRSEKSACHREPNCPKVGTTSDNPCRILSITNSVHMDTCVVTLFCSPLWPTIRCPITYVASGNPYPFAWSALYLLVACLVPSIKTNVDYLPWDNLQHVQSFAWICLHLPVRSGVWYHYEHRCVHNANVLDHAAQQHSACCICKQSCVGIVFYFTRVKMKKYTTFQIWGVNPSVQAVSHCQARAA